MTTKQIEQRLANLERQVSDLQTRHTQPSQGWEALIGIGTDDPVIKEVMKLAMKYREQDRRATRPRTKRKKT